jgi:threonine/homoserine efflux transporter RhtA
MVVAGILAIGHVAMTRLEGVVAVALEVAGVVVLSPLLVDKRHDTMGGAKCASRRGTMLRIVGTVLMQIMSLMRRTPMQPFMLIAHQSNGSHHK